VEENYDVPLFLDLSRRSSSSSRSEPIHAFEKTPSYIRKIGVAAKVHSLYGEGGGLLGRGGGGDNDNDNSGTAADGDNGAGDGIKIVAILRNPVDRAYSHYVMKYERNRPLAASFDDLLRDEIDELRRLGLTTAPRFDNSGVDKIPATTHNAKEDERNLLFELPPLIQSAGYRKHVIQTNFYRDSYNSTKPVDRTSCLYAGMYAEQLLDWTKYFELGKSLLVVQFERLQSDPKATVREILQFLGIPSCPVLEEADVESLLQDRSKHFTGGRRHRRAETLDPLSEEAREYLYRFYQPYNEQLYGLLGLGGNEDDGDRNNSWKARWSAKPLSLR